MSAGSIWKGTLNTPSTIGAPSDDDINEMMMRAFCEPGADAEAELDDKTPEEKINYIRKYVNIVSRDCRCDIGRLLYLEQFTKLSEVNEGLAFDLNLLPQHLLPKIYNMIRREIESPAVK